MPVVENVAEIVSVVQGFPAVFETAKRDWARFRAGVDRGLFTTNQKNVVLDWFDSLGYLWEGIRPNWSESFTPDTPGKLAFMAEVDSWVNRYGSARSGLGVAPLIIAGIAVAAVFGVAGILWAVGYIKEQANVSTVIDNVVSGVVPSDVLETYYQQEGAQAGFVGSVGDIVKWGAVALAIWFAAPIVKGLLDGRKA